MTKFNLLDISILIIYFAVIFVIGFYSNKKNKVSSEQFLLSNRNLSLFLFILTNVATWYGGILGISEFTYKYGIASWFTQGLPYYFFAIIFAFVFSKKIRAASIYTIPDKLESVYGKKVALISAIILFILVNPAPYLLMVAQILTYLFDINMFLSLIIALILSVSYLIKNGFRSDVYTDAFQFFVMFIGFILAVIFAYNNFGGLDFLTNNLPKEHLQVTGNASGLYIAVWFLIALWTFVDPGFHQRCSAARTEKVAFYGILISIIFWFLFDFLTNTFGLYARAILPNLNNPSFSFLILADKIFPAGLKGLFYAALFATIISTLNSFLFISGTTFSRDFIHRFKKLDDKRSIFFTRFGLILSGVISILLAYLIPSVINLWYLIGSICIPGLILIVISAYYPKLKINNRFAFIEILLGLVTSLFWYFLRIIFIRIEIFSLIEPMIIGLSFSVIFHFIALKLGKRFLD